MNWMAHVIRLHDDNIMNKQKLSQFMAIELVSGKNTAEMGWLSEVGFFNH